MTCAKLMQAEDEQARQDRNIGPLISFREDITGSGSPFLPANKVGICVEFWMIGEACGYRAY